MWLTRDGWLVACAGDSGGPASVTPTPPPGSNAKPPAAAAAAAAAPPACEPSVELVALLLDRMGHMLSRAFQLLDLATVEGPVSLCVCFADDAVWAGQSCRAKAAATAAGRHHIGGSCRQSISSQRRASTGGSAGSRKRCSGRGSARRVAAGKGGSSGGSGDGDKRCYRPTLGLGRRMIRRRLTARGV